MSKTLQKRDDANVERLRDEFRSFMADLANRTRDPAIDLYAIADSPTDYGRYIKACTKLRTLAEAMGREQDGSRYRDQAQRCLAACRHFKAKLPDLSNAETRRRLEVELELATAERMVEIDVLRKKFSYVLSEPTIRMLFCMPREFRERILARFLNNKDDLFKSFLESEEGADELLALQSVPVDDDAHVGLIAETLLLEAEAGQSTGARG